MLSGMTGWAQTTLLGKGTNDMFLPAFWLQNTNADRLITGINSQGSLLLATQLIPWESNPYVTDSVFVERSAGVATNLTLFAPSIGIGDGTSGTRALISWTDQLGTVQYELPSFASSGFLYQESITSTNASMSWMDTVSVSLGGTGATTANTALRALGSPQQVTSYASLAALNPDTGAQVVTVAFAGAPDLVYRAEASDPGYGWPLVATNASSGKFWVARPEALSVAWYGAVGDNATSDTAAIAAGLTASALTKAPLVLDGTKTYLLATSLTVARGSALDGDGATLRYTGASIWALAADYKTSLSYKSVASVSTVDGRTRLTLTTAGDVSSFRLGQVAKVISDDVSWFSTGSGDSYAHTGNYFAVHDIGTNYIEAPTTLRDAGFLATNIALFAVPEASSLHLSNFTLNLNTTNTALGIVIEAAYRPTIQNVTVLGASGYLTHGISLRGCVSGEVTACRTELPKYVIGGPLSYGVISGSSFGTVIKQLAVSGGYIGVTTGDLPTVAGMDKHYYGPDEYLTASDSLATGTFVAYDTHTPSYGTLFTSCVSVDCTTAFSNRGREITFIGCSAVRPFTIHSTVAGFIKAGYTNTATLNGCSSIGMKSGGVWFQGNSGTFTAVAGGRYEGQFYKVGQTLRHRFTGTLFEISNQPDVAYMLFDMAAGDTAELYDCTLTLSVAGNVQVKPLVTLSGASSFNWHGGNIASTATASTFPLVDLNSNTSASVTFENVKVLAGQRLTANTGTPAKLVLKTKSNGLIVSRVDETITVGGSTVAAFNPADAIQFGALASWPGLCYKTLASGGSNTSSIITLGATGLAKPTAVEMASTGAGVIGRFVSTRNSKSFYVSQTSIANPATLLIATFDSAGAIQTTKSFSAVTTGQDVRTFISNVAFTAGGTNSAWIDSGVPTSVLVTFEDAVDVAFIGMARLGPTSYVVPPWSIIGAEGMAIDSWAVDSAGRSTTSLLATTVPDGASMVGRIGTVAEDVSGKGRWKCTATGTPGTWFYDAMSSRSTSTTQRTSLDDSTDIVAGNVGSMNTAGWPTVSGWTDLTGSWTYGGGASGTLASSATTALAVPGRTVTVTVTFSGTRAVNSGATLAFTIAGNLIKTFDSNPGATEVFSGQMGTSTGNISILGTKNAGNLDVTIDTITITVPSGGDWLHRHAYPASALVQTAATGPYADISASGTFAANGNTKDLLIGLSDSTVSTVPVAIASFSTAANAKDWILTGRLSASSPTANAAKLAFRGQLLADGEAIEIDTAYDQATVGSFAWNAAGWIYIGANADGADADVTINESSVEYKP